MPPRRKLKSSKSAATPAPAPAPTPATASVPTTAPATTPTAAPTPSPLLPAPAHPAPTPAPSDPTPQAVASKMAVRPPKKYSFLATNPSAPAPSTPAAPLAAPPAVVTKNTSAPAPSTPDAPPTASPAAPVATAAPIALQSTLAPVAPSAPEDAVESMAVDETEVQAPSPAVNPRTAFLHKGKAAAVPEQPRISSDPESEDKMTPPTDVRHVQQPTPEQEDVHGVRDWSKSRRRIVATLSRIREIQDQLDILWETTEVMKEAMQEVLDENP